MPKTKVVRLVTIKQFKRWSYSSLKNYERCPKYAYEYHVLGRKGETGRGASRGTDIHDAMEKFLALDRRQPVAPPVFASTRLFRSELAHLLAVGAIPERDWTFDRFGQVVEDGTAEAWVRLKLDYHYVDEGALELEVGDFKTGKVYDDHPDQVELYGTVGLLYYNTLRLRARRKPLVGVRGALWYGDKNLLARVDPGTGRPLYWTAAQAFENMKQWHKRVKPMFVDREFQPTPNKYCYNCHLSRKRGGDCRYG